MLHRIDQLEGALLDYAVMVAVGEKPEILDGHCVMRVKPPYDPLIGPDFYRYDPSKNWTSMGPLIQREKITIIAHESGWTAVCGAFSHYIDFGLPAFEYDGAPDFSANGDKPLIAACRAFCLAKLGPTIDIPEAE